MVGPLQLLWILLVICAITDAAPFDDPFIFQKGPEIRTGIMRDETDVCQTIWFMNTIFSPIRTIGESSCWPRVHCLYRSQV